MSHIAPMPGFQKRSSFLLLDRLWLVVVVVVESSSALVLSAVVVVARVATLSENVSSPHVWPVASRRVDRISTHKLQ